VAMIERVYGALKSFIIFPNNAPEEAVAVANYLAVTSYKLFQEVGCNSKIIADQVGGVYHFFAEQKELVNALGSWAHIISN